VQKLCSDPYPNTEAYPQSGNVYDSLGEAYLTDGRRELAIQNYEKSLQLDPKNANAVEKLKELKAWGQEAFK